MGSREQKLDQFLFPILTITLMNRKVLFFADRLHNEDISINHPLGNTIPRGPVFLQWNYLSNTGETPCLNRPMKIPTST
jgi:hypothetical protein